MAVPCRDNRRHAELRLTLRIARSGRVRQQLSHDRDPLLDPGDPGSSTRLRSMAGRHCPTTTVLRLVGLKPSDGKGQHDI